MPNLPHLLPALLLPPQPHAVSVETCVQDAQRALLRDAKAGALYLDMTLPSGLFQRLAALRALRKLWQTLATRGLQRRRLYRLLLAGSEVYEAVAIAGMPPLAPATKSWAALALRGGRVALCAWMEGQPVCDRMIAQANTMWDAGTGATLYLGSGHVFRLAGREEMLRIPSGSQSVARLARGFEALNLAATLRLDFAVPRAIRRDEVAGHSVFVESRVPHAGFDYLNMTAGQRAAVSPQAVQAIVQLHESARRVRACTSEDVDGLFNKPVQRLIVEPLMAGVRQRLESFLAAVRREFDAQPIATALSHGDCKIANFLHDGAFHVRGLVDWDRAAIDGLPGVDLVHYLAFDDMLAGRGTIAETLLARAQAMETAAEWADYRKRFLIEDFRWRAVATMSLILHMAEQLEAGNEQANAEMRDMPAVVARALDWALAAISPAA